jgi:predicted enzyme related to lactoylglutathione lyase
MLATGLSRSKKNLYHCGNSHARHPEGRWQVSSDLLSSFRGIQLSTGLPFSPAVYPVGASMKRVTGLRGTYFKARGPEKFYGWYEKNLGLKRQGEQGFVFKWREQKDPGRTGFTVWALFPAESNYSPSDFMLNYRVTDLDVLLETLRAEGVTIDPRRENSDYGRFPRIIEPEGNRIELCELSQTQKRTRKKGKPRIRSRKRRLAHIGANSLHVQSHATH